MFSRPANAPGGGGEEGGREAALGRLLAWRRAPLTPPTGARRGGELAYLAYSPQGSNRTQQSDALSVLRCAVTNG